MTTLQGSVDLTKIKDKSVIITGGASGLGEATTIKLAENGAYVTIADMAVEAGTKLADRLTSQGQYVSFVACDTTDWASSVNAFKHAVNFSPTKTLDVAILFAGTDGAAKGLVDEVLQSPEPTLDDEPPPPVTKAIQVNTIGEYMSTSLALHYFRLPGTSAQASRTKKSLILVASMMGYIDLPYNTDYSVSKFAIRGLFRSIRSETHKVNARCNVFLPGYLLTPLTQRIHKINDPKEPSKATGFVLPWAPVSLVVDACVRCVVDDSLDGRALGIFPSGIVDIDEEIETGYGGKELLQVLERDGFFDIKSLFPRRGMNLKA